MENNFTVYLSRCFAFIKMLGLIISFILLFNCAMIKSNRTIPSNLAQQIRQLCEEYPPPSDFVSVDKPESITKPDRGTYGGWYLSSMNSNDVIAYYSNLLSKNNWTLKHESSHNIFTNKETEYVSFEKDGFYLAIEFSSSETMPVNEKKTYGLNCGFTP